MKHLLLLIILFFTINKTFSQECGNLELSTFLEQKKANDTIYKIDIELRIKYFSALNKEILPKYAGLKKDIQNKMENTTLEDISELKKIYDNNRLDYLDEMNETQARSYNNLTPYSKINNILIFETLDVFPDSYAIMFNPTILKRKHLERASILMDKVYQKYSADMTGFNSCIQKMTSEMKEAKAALGIVEINQNTENKTKEETEKADLIDILIWAQNDKNIGR